MKHTKLGENFNIGFMAALDLGSDVHRVVFLPGIECVYDKRNGRLTRVSE
ncbi:MAG: hypothetical protein HOH43_13925 [Candidatus Latescibacteria bacterium]|nr:hypothetical protein [Candidatus Latescibacterota bacterium]